MALVIVQVDVLFFIIYIYLIQLTILTQIIRMYSEVFNLCNGNMHDDSVSSRTGNGSNLF